MPFSWEFGGQVRAWMLLCAVGCVWAFLIFVSLTFSSLCRGWLATHWLTWVSDLGSTRRLLNYDDANAHTSLARSKNNSLARSGACLLCEPQARYLGVAPSSSKFGSWAAHKRTDAFLLQVLPSEGLPWNGRFPPPGGSQKGLLPSNGS